MAKLTRVPNFNGRMSTTPVPYRRTKRPHLWGGMTSAPAGKMVPVAYAPLFREDAAHGYIDLQTEMMETHELLANKVYGRYRAYFVPFLALSRFNGSRDLFDKSYMQEPLVEGGDVVPWIETMEHGEHGEHAVLKYLGMHANEGDDVNSSVIEAVNVVWNFLAVNRSKDITLRDRLDDTLPRAFWELGRFEDVVPDFDQAVIDGEVALNVVAGQLGLTGPAPIRVEDGQSVGVSNNADGSGMRALQMNNTGNQITYSGAALGATGTVKAVNGLETDLSEVYAEMQQNGITVSLSQIDRAREMRAFAKLRERFTGHGDDWIINMLMDGIHIPELDGKQPILLADQLVNFAQAKRYATDGDNLAKSAVSGGVRVRLPIHVPRANTGGLIMVFAEHFPAQMFERQRDPWLHTKSVDQLPEAMRDYLDPEKVDIVTNGEVDNDHDTPNDTFGYAPQHWKWYNWPIQNGGDFFQPKVDGANDVNRQRFWPLEIANPTLSESFYLVPDLVSVPFLSEEGDPFQIAKSGGLVITGNTQPGGKLHEAEDNYDAVNARADGGFIQKPNNSEEE